MIKCRVHPDVEVSAWTCDCVTVENAKLKKELDRAVKALGVDNLTKYEWYAGHSPVTFEMVKMVWGSDDICLSEDTTRIAFFSVWALLNHEYASAMLREKMK